MLIENKVEIGKAGKTAYDALKKHVVDQNKTSEAPVELSRSQQAFALLRGNGYRAKKILQNKGREGDASRGR